MLRESPSEGSISGACEPWGLRPGALGTLSLGTGHFGPGTVVLVALCISGVS